MLADRLNKRWLMFATQTALMVFAFALGFLVLADVVTVGWVTLIAAGAGTAWALDQPVRRTIVTELVGDDLAANAVSLNGALNYVAKTIGPLVAALVVAVAGIGWCFVLNGVSSIAVLVALGRLDEQTMYVSERIRAGRHQIREGLRYCWANRQVRNALLLLGVVLVTFNWQVLLPVLARRELAASTAAYGVLVGLLSAGSTLGSLWLASRREVSASLLALACVGFGSAVMALGVAPILGVAYPAVLALGACSSVVIHGGAVEMQLATTPAMRGRVMAVFSIVALGGIALTGPIVGWCADRYGARACVSAGGGMAAAFGLISRRRLGERRRSLSPWHDLDAV